MYKQHRNYGNHINTEPPKYHGIKVFANVLNHYLHNYKAQNKKVGILLPSIYFLKIMLHC